MTAKKSKGLNGHAIAFWREVEMTAKKMTEARAAKHRATAEVWLRERLPTLVVEVADLLSTNGWEYKDICLFELETPGHAYAELDLMKVRVFDEYFGVSLMDHARQPGALDRPIDFIIQFGDFRKMFGKNSAPVGSRSQA